MNSHTTRHTTATDAVRRLRRDGAHLDEVASGAQDHPNPDSAIVAAPEHVEVVRVLQDGAFVAVHSRVQGDTSAVAFDVFRFDGDRIVERWEAAQAESGPNASGHTMTDGPTETGNVASTEVTRQVVEGLARTILFERDLDRLGEFYDGEQLIQHNPQFGDGVDGMRQAFGGGDDSPGKYHEIYRVVAEGELGLVISRGEFYAQPYVMFDLYRVADGYVSEHWDVILVRAAADSEADTAVLGGLAASTGSIAAVGSRA